MDLDRLKARIQALRSKTVANGCTEQEAMAAAAKVAALLDQYQLSLSDVELRQERCARGGIDTGRRQRGPIDGCVTAVAGFCDCRVWRESSDRGEIRYVFFGLRPDVEAAHYLYDVIDAAMDLETLRYKRTRDYLGYHPDDRRTVVRSFLIGMANSIADKLAALKAERDRTNRATTGRDLVVVKHDLVEEELARLDLVFRRPRAANRLVAKSAFEAGRQAGRRFSPRPGVAAAKAAE